MDAAKTAALKQQIEAEFARFEAREHPQDFPALPPLPAGRYTDQAFFAAENDHMWRKSWLLAGHIDELPEGGSYKLWRDTGQPVLLVRGHDGVVRGFYNTCRHRGGPLVREAQGEVTQLVCQYHCWAYDLEGQLKFVPDAHEFPALNKEDHPLIPVRTELWGNWMFINFDEGAAPLSTFFGQVMDEWADYDPANIRFVSRHYLPINCNWKVAMDAFQEVYHLKHIHPNTVDQLLDHRGAVMTLYENGHSRMVVPNKEGMSAALGGKPSDDPAHEITRDTNRSYNLFPNIVTPTSEFDFPFLLFWPDGINKTNMEVVWWTREQEFDAHSEDWVAQRAIFDVVLGEDTENLAFIQEAMETPGFQSVPLSYQERRIYSHHEEIDRRIGKAVPSGLAIPQILEPFWEG